MPSTSGSDAQNAAKNDKTAQDSTQISAKQSCKTALQVTCVRADSKKGVKDITVKAADTTKTSAEATGLADFGEVAAGTYEIEVELSENDAKKYKAPAKKSVDIAKGKTETVKLELEPRVNLEIVLIDNNGNAVNDAEWTLSAPLQTNGKTGQDGKISIVDFPWNAKDGALEVTMPNQADAVAAAAVAAAVEYPPAIKPADFRDEAPKAFDNKINWKLAIDDIEKRDDEEGVKARLHNLGFSVGAQKTERAVKVYQRLFTRDQNPTGKPADIKDDIKKRHDAP